MKRSREKVYGEQRAGYHHLIGSPPTKLCYNKYSAVHIIESSPAQRPTSVWPSKPRFNHPHVIDDISSSASFYPSVYASPACRSIVLNTRRIEHSLVFSPLSKTTACVYSTLSTFNSLSWGVVRSLIFYPSLPLASIQRKCALEYLFCLIDLKSRQVYNTSSRIASFSLITLRSRTIP